MCEISIIVPVYKAEKYIGECVGSILAQSYPYFELILVDDGSPDKSGEMCDQYALRDSRITVIHQENKGVSAARNVGIGVAKGDWLCFVDSDDYISRTYLEDFMNLPAADLLLQGYVTEEGKEVIAEHSINKICNNVESAIIEAEKQYILNSPCFKLFRRCIVGENNLLFDSNTSYGEDHLFTLSYIKFVKTISISPNKGYHQVISSKESLSQRMVPSEFLLYYMINLRKSIEEIYGEDITPELLSVYNENLYNHIKKYLISFFHLNSQYNQYREDYNHLKKYIRRYTYGLVFFRKLFCTFYAVIPPFLSYIVFSIMIKLYKR